MNFHVNNEQKDLMNRQKIAKVQAKDKQRNNAVSNLSCQQRKQLVITKKKF